MVCLWHLILTDKNHLTLFHHQFALSFFIITPFSKSTTNRDFRWNNPTSRKVFFCQHEAVESLFASYANNVFVTYRYVNTFTQNIYVHGYEIIFNKHCHFRLNKRKTGITADFIDIEQLQQLLPSKIVPFVLFLLVRSNLMKFYGNQ